MIVRGFQQYELKVKLEFRELRAENFWKELRKTKRKKNNKVNLYTENHDRIIVTIPSQVEAQSQSLRLTESNQLLYLCWTSRRK